MPPRARRSADSSDSLEPLTKSKDADSDSLLPSQTPSGRTGVSQAKRLVFAVLLLGAALSALFLIGPYIASSRLGRASMSSPVVTSEMKALGEHWASIRSVQGHWSGGEFNKEVDSPTRTKKKVLDSLLPLFVQGSPASLVLQVLGKPDSIVTRLPGVHADAQAAGEGLPLMPGPAVAGDSANAAGEGEYYMIYSWRGLHDYIWFKVQGKDEKIVESDWYMAFE